VITGVLFIPKIWHETGNTSFQTIKITIGEDVMKLFEMFREMTKFDRPLISSTFEDDTFFSFFSEKDNDFKSPLFRSDQLEMLNIKGIKVA
jgi:hypothetical protein